MNHKDVTDEMVEAAIIAYDGVRCMLNEKWHGGTCEPMSDTHRDNIKPMMLAAIEAALFVKWRAEPLNEAESEIVEQHLSDLRGLFKGKERPTGLFSDRP